MKTVIFLFAILFFKFSSCYSQTFTVGSSEQDFVDYFKSNKLESIEGLWIRKSTYISKQTYPETNDNERQSTDEVELAIIEILGTINLFYIKDGYCYSKGNEACKIAKSAVPNRYFFSSDFKEICFEVVSQSFVITNNKFSITYTHRCNFGTGTTMGTAVIFDRKTTDNWNKIYPE